MVLKFCKTTIQKVRSGYYALVEHGTDQFQVYMDGTVLLNVGGTLYNTNRHNGKLLSHVRYNGRRMLRLTGVVG